MSVSGPNSSAGTAPVLLSDAPPEVLNGNVIATGQTGFDERQGVLLGSNLRIDGGWIAAGTVVDSHMIFLNAPDRNRIIHNDVMWNFSGDILGVMSDRRGRREAASNSILGAIGTSYEAPFRARGMERNDSYSISGNVLTVNMRVTQPGDWIRVVTVSVPDAGSTFLFLGVGLLSLAAMRRRVNRR